MDNERVIDCIMITLAFIVGMFIAVLCVVGIFGLIDIHV